MRAIGLLISVPAIVLVIVMIIGEIVMSFSFIDFVVGFLMAGAMVHVVVSSAKIRFPSVFGYSAKANLVHGLIVAISAVNIYFFNYGFNATIENGMLMGAFDLILIYALFGRMLHKRITKKTVLVQQG